MSAKEIAFIDLKQEFANTRRMLERVPDGKFDWQPHAKSTNLGALAQHVATLPRMFERVAATDELDVQKWQRPPQAETTAEILTLFDEASAAASAAFDQLSEEDLQKEWALLAGGQVYFKLPRVQVLRTFAISHLVHHRGQLSVYLRLLDVPVPGVFGPSADER